MVANTKPLLTPATLHLEQLPNEPAALKGLIVELVAALHEQQLHADNLQWRLDQLLHRLYGRRSERLNAAQLLLFGPDPDVPATPTPDRVDDDDTAGTAKKKRRGSHGRQVLPEHLPRRQIRHELTEAERSCPCCGQIRIALGEEVSEQLEYVPASLTVVQHVRVTYLCRRCEHTRLQPPADSTPAATAAVDATTQTTNPANTTAADISPPSSVLLPQTILVATPPQLEDAMPAFDPTATKAASAVTGSVTPVVVLVAADSPARASVATPLTATVLVAAAGTTADAPATHGTPGGVVAPGLLPSTFVTAPLPPQAIPRCLAGPGLLAHVIVSKFDDHLPLYRQERILAREGVYLSRSTLCDWLAGCAAVLQPLFMLMWQRVFASRYLHTDDTYVAVQDQPGKGNLWVYYGDSAHRYVVYDFTTSRAAERPVECLQAFKGFLHADALPGYDKVFGKERQEVGCWAHTRRYFYDARLTKPVPACHVLGTIGRLYALEAAAKYAAQVEHLSEADFWEVRWQLRQRQAIPLLTGLRQYLDKTRPEILPQSPLGEAFTYLANQWATLQRYTEHGFLDIDNNVAEQVLRGVALGRKNWLFMGSAEGGKTAAVLLSFTQTCKRLGVEPWLYLREMLTVLPTIAESERATALPALLPDVWAQAQGLGVREVVPP